mmetsp:Transcript_52026/g.96335  ORF Transcript_52026/g.96335 Transcript_52026/m.96335 type:complete len:247 (+) Transcript_52026:47-787(+)
MRGKVLLLLPCFARLVAAAVDPVRMVQLPWESGGGMPDEVQPETETTTRPRLGLVRRMAAAKSSQAPLQLPKAPEMPGATAESVYTERSSPVLLPLDSRASLAGGLPLVDKSSRTAVVREFEVDPKDIPAQPQRLALTSQTQQKAVSSTEVRGHPRMKAECEEFATWMKDSGIKGAHRVSMWKATCGQLVASGGASDKYKLMCDTLGEAVAGLEGQAYEDNPIETCKVVLRIFHDSGIGASPLEEA